MQALPNCAPDGGNACRLTYAVEIKPKGFLPVKLIEGRIATDLKSNLAAIRDHVEKLRDIAREKDERDGIDRGRGGDGGDCVVGGKVIVGIIHLVERGANGGAQIGLEVGHMEVDPGTPIDTLNIVAEKKEFGEGVYRVDNSLEATDSDVMTLANDKHARTLQSNSMNIMRSDRSNSKIDSNASAFSEADKKKLFLENEDFQRVVAALERDLGLALLKIREIRALSGTVLLTETA